VFVFAPPPSDFIEEVRGRKEKAERSSRNIPKCKESGNM
jgi:hypothetical protein